MCSHFTCDDALGTRPENTFNDNENCGQKRFA
nr:MAG TPA: hypothetical protein [Siphoviridae sp. ctHdl3]